MANEGFAAETGTINWKYAPTGNSKPGVNGITPLATLTVQVIGRLFCGGVRKARIVKVSGARAAVDAEYEDSREAETVR